MAKKPGKRVIALSRVDQERLDRAQIHTPEEAFDQYAYRARPIRANRAEHGAKKRRKNHSDLTALDRDILENVPPHFGKL